MMALSSSPTLRGTLLNHEPMSKHTSWRVGGPADHYYKPADIDDLGCYLTQLPSGQDITWVGLGSNLLVRDGGIRGSVIATSGLLNGLNVSAPLQVQVDAGVACAKVARFCARNEMQGAEFLAGIPGTMGGALAMNAGAFGGETWDIVKRVETINRGGQRRWRQREEFAIGYRSVEGLESDWFISAELSLVAGDKDSSLKKIKQWLNKRGQSQPIQMPNAGSVFRNPPDDYAARLIEASGLKGFCIGGACVSEKHANFIINTGTALAADIEKLIEHVAHVVAQQHTVQLHREVRIIGEALV